MPRYACAECPIPFFHGHGRDNPRVPADRERDRDPKLETRAWVVLANGDMTSVPCASDKITRVLALAEQHVVRAGSGGISWNFEPFLRTEGGEWCLATVREDSRLLPNAGFPGYMADLARDFYGPGVIMMTKDRDYNTAHIMPALPDKPTRPAHVAEADWDDEDATNAVYEKFFAELIIDWERYHPRFSLAMRQSTIRWIR